MMSGYATLSWVGCHDYDVIGSVTRRLVKTRNSQTYLQNLTCHEAGA